MYSYSVVQWLFFFYFYCFFGWCFESTYVSIKNRKLVNRGFIRGPFLPLYGSGAIMMLLVSMPFQENIILVFVAGAIGATVLEYVTGVTMEALFKVRYWDYSNNKFNFQGHICLGTSLAWGFLTILMTEVIHKPIERFILGIPVMAMTGMTIGLTLIISADFIMSFKTALNLRGILIKMEEAKGEMLRVQKRLDVIIAVANEEIALKKQALSEKKEAIADVISDVIARGREGLSASLELKMEESSQEKYGRKVNTTGNVGERLGEFAGSIGERMDNLSESIGEKMDDLSESIGEKMDNLSESIGEKMDGLSESIGEKMDDLSESLGECMDDLSESIESHMKEIAERIEEKMEEFSENMETRMEDLKKSIEEKFIGIKGIYHTKDSSYIDKSKEELRQLLTKYRRNVDDRERLGHVKSFYQRNMLRSNPTMYSVRFREALEELKQKAEEKVERKSLSTIEFESAEADMGYKNDKSSSDISKLREKEESQEAKK